ncbi:Bromodomain-containing protein [Phycomyces nitens]|nr:Bromodomain-containing protein [Phycomyces nitens]
MANGYSMDHPPQATTETSISLNTTGNRPKVNDDDDKHNLKKRPKLDHKSIPLETNMTKDQLKYCGAIIRHLKKHRDAAPFLHPVDYVSLNVPDYPKIVKHPMDLNTVDRKLSNLEYTDVEDMIADIRLVFSNCYKFNGPEAMISMLCQNVESAFEKSLRQMPPSKRETSPTPPRQHSMSDKVHRKKKTQSPPPVRRISEDGRPKREIHPPPSKDYPETITKRRTMNPRKNDLEMKFCAQTLRELKKSKYRDINFPFIAPVDIVALNIPDYPTIVKNPIDLSTIENKLAEGFYDSPEAFEADIRLMFSNCYLYNPPAIPVHRMGRELEKVFDEKWKQKPAPVQEEETFDEFEEVESDEDERDHKISELERHIASLAQQIASIKSKKKRPERLPKPIKTRPTSPKDKKPFSKRHRLSLKTKEDELPEFTFEQKKDLSERINNLTGDRLNTVVNIIQSSMPNLDGQGQEEIVLDIDALDRKTLHRLHEFVTGRSLVPHSSLSSQKKSSSKRPRTHYSEADADRKIKELEKTLQKFSGSEPDAFYGKLTWVCVSLLNLFP